MKTVMVLEGAGHDPQALQQILRDHGYTASEMSESDWRAEEALRQSEQRYKSIYENAPVGIFRSTLDGKFISVNSAGARMLKYASPQELMDVVNRTSIAEVLYMDPRHRQEVLERILTRSGWRVCEERFRCKDGSLIEVIFHIRAVPGTDGGLVELEGFVEDITERKQKDEALRFTQYAIDKTIDQAFWMTEDACLFYVNDAACRALGYSREELVGMSIPDIDPNFPSEVFAEHWRELKEKGSVSFESWHRSKDGRAYPVEIRANYVVFDGQEYNCAFATDISERKAAEEALRLTQFAIDKTPDQAFWGTPEGRFLYVNEAACAALGYSREELVGMSISDIDVDFSADGLIAQWQKLKRCGAKRFETHHRAKDGRIYPVEIRSNYVNFDGKEYRCAFATDISKRKQAEEALQESEQRYREVFENTSDCLFLLDVTADGRFKFAGFNPAEEKAVGLLSADTTGKFVEEVIPRELADQVIANYRRCVEAGTTINYEEQLNLPAGNRFFQTVLIPVRNAAAEIYRIIGIAHDTTESRRVEKELRLASLVVESSPAVLFRWRVDEGWPVEMVTRNIRQFGYAPEELLSGAVPYAALVHPADFGQVEAEFQAHICRGENNFNREYRIITKQEEVRWVDERTLIERDAEGRVTHCQGVVIDITERKRTELVMAARLRLLQFAPTHTLDELLEATLNEAEALTVSRIGFYHFLEADQKTLLLQNWSTRTKKEFCKAEGKGLHYKVSAAGVWVDCIHQRRPVIHDDYASLPHRKGLPPGHATVDRELVVPVFRGEKIVAVLGVGNKLQAYTQQDVEMVSFLADLAWTIAERKQAEEALRESERKYRSIIEHAPFGITRSTRDGKLLSVNPALASILKYESAQELQETINRNSIQDVLFPEPSERAPLVEEILANDSWYVFNNRLRCKDGSVVTCRVHSRRILDEDGRTSEFDSFQENITDQLAAEQALRESEEKFRVLAETSPTAICIYQGESITYANPAMERLFGYSADELCRMKFWEWAAEDCKEMIRERGLARLAGEPVPGQYEARYVTKNSEERCVLISAGTMEYQGRPTGVACFLDISERKMTEEKIKTSLAEKEVLLREIHHRVKNNLQVVSSLLYLQAQKFSDPELQTCFLESQNRICSMALAHEQLYQSKNLSEVSVKAYAENLVNQLCQIFHCPDQTIDCCLEVEDLELDIEKIIPCGLLITELLSNAYKHAFVDGRPGQITISIKKVGSEMGLSVADTGIGFPGEIDYLHARTLGLQLVMALVNQLNGTLELDRSRGTLFRVRFAG